MFRKGFASFLIAAAATAALSTSVTAQVRTAALQSTGFQLAQAAQAESRVALVIGNSAYQVNKPLNNPVNDAQAVSQMLNLAGFEVVMAFDEGREQLFDLPDGGHRVGRSSAISSSGNGVGS